jgi:cholera toxin transcriptional activator
MHETSPRRDCLSPAKSFPCLRVRQKIAAYYTGRRGRRSATLVRNMPSAQPDRRYRFGVFEADSATGELRRQGLRIRLKAQPFQLLLMLLERPGELVTREEICRALWPQDTFVDFEHGVNSAINRLREALGDTANNPRFIETLPRRGYRFVAPVQRAGEPEIRPASQGSASDSVVVSTSNAVSVPLVLNGLLAAPEDLPQAPRRLVQFLYVALQLMYLGFYIGALTNLEEIHGLVAALPGWTHAYEVLVATAVLLIPPDAPRNLLRLWPFLLAMDVLWALSPLLLIHHIPVGLALACTALLVYSPFAQRSLVLMGAGAR